MEQSKKSAAENPRAVGFAAVCQQVRSALEPTRTHCVSLHDAGGDVLWMSEGSMGPDEHSAVHEAAAAFRSAQSPPIRAYDLGDARTAVIIRCVGAQRATLGMVMLVIDSRGFQKNPAALSKIITPGMQRAVAEFTKLQIAASTLPAAPALPKRIEPPVNAELDRLNAALRRSPIALHVQRLVPLAKGSKLRRYEVLLRSKVDAPGQAAPQDMLKTAVQHGLGSMIDRRVLTELIGWLIRNRDVWTDQRASFSVNLTTTALHDEHFVKFVELCMTKASLPQGLVSFEVDAPTAHKMKKMMPAIAAALQKVGCPLVLDDFDLRAECFELLRVPGVSLLKLAPSVTAKLRTDKISQASITAVAQMARVLGIHTVAKRTESPAEQEWLTALGVDFVQSNAFSPPVAIERLAAQASSPKTTPVPA